MFWGSEGKVSFVLPHKSSFHLVRNPSVLLHLDWAHSLYRQFDVVLPPVPRKRGLLERLVMPSTPLKYIVVFWSTVMTHLLMIGTQLVTILSSMTLLARTLYIKLDPPLGLLDLVSLVLLKTVSRLGLRRLELNAIEPNIPHHYIDVLHRSKRYPTHQGHADAMNTAFTLQTIFSLSI